MSEKTEQPTPQRLRKARSDGQVARSPLLSSGCVTAGGFAGLMVGFPTGAARLQGFTTTLFLQQQFQPASLIHEALVVLGWLVGPALVGAVLASFAISAATAGFRVDAQVLAPKLDRLNPVQGLKRLFRVRNLVDAAKNLAIAAIIAVILWGDIQDAGPDVLRAVYLEGTGSLAVVLALLSPMLTKLCVVVLVLGGLDYLLARRRHTRDLMMTREEVKQEYKNAEGDPHSKAMRKAAHQALAMQGPARGVQKATAVVVNPTHIAVALRYDPAECDAPYIVASGRDQDAFAIRREAKRQGIPVIKDIPLARSLIHYDVGEEIPEELYRAAAAVLKAAMDVQNPDASPRSRTP